MIGQTLSRYRILDRLGEGGMGIVYRARDERLERDVALKLLTPGTIADEDTRARFRNEALALSRLNHPSIAMVFDFDREANTDFLVMEYVPGETLAKKLEAGPLPAHEVCVLGAQIADALEAAHEQGVVHRDLKPGNILITPRGQAKVLDFGLAKFLRREGETSTSLTNATSLPGTLAYMAPEQLLDQTVDPRTDVYALGTVLYEMASGRRPHTEDRPTALIYAIVNSPAPPLGHVRPAIPARLGELILKAIEKSPERRHATARQLADELRALGAATSARAQVESKPRIESLAVLPLANLSGDAAQEFFADGMTEALIGELAQLRALRVISRTSAMQYKGTRKPLPEIARELRVDAIVEGAVQRSGDRVRISAQLIDGASDRHLWAQSYERDLGDVLALQSEVARAIVREIRVQLTPEERDRLAGTRTVDPEAHLAYLKGRYQWNKRTREALMTSIEMFEQAIAIDPGYALAYAGLSDSYNVLTDLQAAAPKDVSRKAMAAALKSLEIEERQAEAHTSLGYTIYYFGWKWAEAEGEFRRALEINPGYATGHQWYGLLLSAQGRHDEGIAEALRALELDPLSMIIYTSVGDAHYFARRYEGAIEHYRKAIEMDPGFVPAHTDLARALEEMRRWDEAIAEYEIGRSLGKGQPQPSSGLAHVYARSGRREEALALLHEMIELRARRFISPYSIGSIYASLGDPDRAFEWIGRAIEEHDHALVWLKVHPRLDSLRSDPRFADMLRRMELAP